MSDSSTVYDADAHATAAPELRIGGRVFVGRILSIIEWTAFGERFEKAGVTDVANATAQTLATMQDAFAEYLRVVFPPITERRWFRRVPVDPIGLLEAADPMGVLKAFPHFFVHQRRAMGVTRRPPTDPATTGSPSQGPGNISTGRAAPAPDGAPPTG